MYRTLDLRTRGVLLAGRSLDWDNCHDAAKLVPVTDDGLSRGHANVSGLTNQHALYTFNGYQYIAYYTSSGSEVWMNKRVAGGHWGQGSLVESGLSPSSGNSHRMATFGIDRNGYIHICYHLHSNPLKYRTSVNPEDITAWSALKSMTGSNENQVTYPTFLINPVTGKLYFMYRDGASGNGETYFNAYDEITQTWSSIKLIDGKSTPLNAYPWKPKFDKSGCLHLFWNWRDGGDNDQNHDICYAKWDGARWKKSDGTIYTLPINPTTAEEIKSIATGDGLGELFSSDADASNRPHAVYWMKSPDSLQNYLSIFHIYHNGTSWVDSEVLRTKNLVAQGYTGNAAFPVSRPEIVINRDSGEAFIIYRSLSEGNGISVLRSLDYTTWYKVPIVASDMLNWHPAYDRALWLNEKKLHLFVQAASISWQAVTATSGGGHTWMAPVRSPIYVLELIPERLPLFPIFKPVGEMKTILSFQLAHNPNIVTTSWGTAIEGTWFSLRNDLLPPGCDRIYVRFIGQLKNDTAGQKTTVGIRHAYTLDGTALDTDFSLESGAEAGGNIIEDSGWIELTTIGPHGSHKGGTFYVEGKVTGGTGNIYGTILIAAC